MKKTISCLTIGAFAAAMFWTGYPASASAKASASTPPAFQDYDSQQGYYPNGAWAVPPQEWQAIQQRGFRDGVRGAYKDAQNHRQPNVENRDEYRNPDDVPQRDIAAYREAFRRGYWTGVRHLMGYYNGPNPYSSSAYQQYGPPQGPGYYPNEPWAAPPPEWQAVQQKGFRDGVRGAYKDAQNHRPPNVNNRDEYRHPDVPHRDRHAYREAFRRGYWTGVRHLMGYYHGRNPYGDSDDYRH